MAFKSSSLPVGNTAGGLDAVRAKQADCATHYRAPPHLLLCPGFRSPLSRAPSPWALLCRAFRARSLSEHIRRCRVQGFVRADARRRDAADARAKPEPEGRHGGLHGKRKARGEGDAGTSSASRCPASARGVRNAASMGCQPHSLVRNSRSRQYSVEPSDAKTQKTSGGTRLQRCKTFITMACRRKASLASLEFDNIC